MASLSARRAWIEIFKFTPANMGGNRSLSARRAWIEIQTTLRDFLQGLVALRKESVDRNHDGMLKYRDAEQSLSARRAWIEISGWPGNVLRI